MDSQTLDKQFTAVALLCNKYLQKDREAMRLLNKVLNMAADFAIIDHKVLDNPENEMDDYFDYAEEMQELIHELKMLEKDLERNELLSMGNYSSETPKEIQ